MRIRIALAVSLALTFPSSAPAIAKAQSTSAAAMTLRLSPARIDRALRQMVQSDRVAGATVLIWKNGREIYFHSAGYADREAKKPFGRDTLTQVWSMTKPVTGVALMTLWVQGRFGLDEPLAKYLPEYADVMVFAGLDSAGKPVLRTPARPIVIRISCATRRVS